MFLAVFVIDFRPLVDQVIVPVLGTVLVGVAGPVAVWALKKVGDAAHVTISTQLSKRVEAAMQNAATLVVGRAQQAADANSKITVSYQMVADAANYVSTKMGPELAKLGITPDSLAERLEARILAKLT